MKKSLLFIMIISLLSFSAIYADNSSGKESNIDEQTQQYEDWLKTGQKTSSETNTDTSTVIKTKTETETKTNTNTSSDSTSSTDGSNTPFDDDTLVTNPESAQPTKIADLDTAEACGIKEIAKGFPKDGTISGTGSDNLRLRSWPWGNVIGLYPSGTSVKILGESGEFYLVEIDGKQGYMHKNYVSTSDKSASGVAPYYPGNTRSGGSLPLKDGVQASKDGAEGKVPQTVSGGTPGKVTISNDKVVLDVPQKNQYQANTPAPGSSCGPTSLAMCLSFFGKGDPSVLVTDLYNVCGCTASDGTGHAGLEKGAHKYGLTNAKFYYSVSQDWCRQQLKEGKPVLCHVAHHYVVMKGIDANGNVILNDPAWKTVERTMSWSDFSVWWSNSGLGHSAMTF